MWVVAGNPDLKETFLAFLRDSAVRMRWKRPRRQWTLVRPLAPRESHSLVVSWRYNDVSRSESLTSQSHPLRWCLQKISTWKSNKEFFDPNPWLALIHLGWKNTWLLKGIQYANPIGPKLKERIFHSADIGCVFNSYWHILLNKCGKKFILCHNY